VVVGKGGVTALSAPYQGTAQPNWFRREGERKKRHRIGSRMGGNGACCRGRKAIAIVKGPCELQNRHSEASKWKRDPVALAILLCLDSRYLPIEFQESSTSICRQSSAKIAL
jgi:hypothetical protein